jgi:hypothetical protein
MTFIPFSTGRAAGGLFGIDLAGLFKDDDTNGGGFQGFLSPAQTTALLKGRSPGTMTYRAAKTPSRTTTYMELPEQKQEAAKQEAATQQTKADRLLSSFIDANLGDPNKKVLGAVGLGRALEYGLTPEQLKTKAKTEGITFGEQAAKHLGISDLNQYINPTTGKAGVLGLEAVEKARGSGMSDELIRNLAKQQNLGFGEKASSALGVTTGTPGANSGGPDLGKFIDISAGGTPGMLGLAAVNKARQSGLTDAQIRQYAGEQRLGFGQAALASLR